MSFPAFLCGKGSNRGAAPDVSAWGRTDYSDFDTGSDVDGSDLAEFAAAYGFTSADNNYNALCDFDSDGDVDGSDVNIFGEEFGKT